jgi:hypothetical protein
LTKRTFFVGILLSNSTLRGSKLKHSWLIWRHVYHSSMKSTLLLHKDLRAVIKREMYCTAISSAKWTSILDCKSLRVSKCGKGRWRIFGTLILANYTKGLRNGLDAMQTQYVNCLTRTWEPNWLYKGHDWIPANSVFVSWMHITNLKSDLITIEGNWTEKKISILGEQHSHFQNYLSLLQDTESDDDHVE